MTYQQYLESKGTGKKYSNTELSLLVETSRMSVFIDLDALERTARERGDNLRQKELCTLRKEVMAELGVTDLNAPATVRAIDIAVKQKQKLYDAMFFSVVFPRCKKFKEIDDQNEIVSICWQALGRALCRVKPASNNKWTDADGKVHHFYSIVKYFKTWSLRYLIDYIASKNRISVPSSISKLYNDIQHGREVDISTDLFTKYCVEEDTFTQELKKLNLVKKSYQPVKQDEAGLQKLLTETGICECKDEKVVCQFNNEDKELKYLATCKFENLDEPMGQQGEDNLTLGEVLEDDKNNDKLTTFWMDTDRAFERVIAHFDDMQVTTYLMAIRGGISPTMALKTSGLHSRKAQEVMASLRALMQDYADFSN